VRPAVADVSALLRVLVEHDVEFVVVGGVCAVIQGAPVSTFDLDVVPNRSADNVERLLQALASIDAQHRDLGGRSIAPDAGRLSGPGHNLFMTRSGPIDVLGTIGRGRDYASLEPRSRPVDVGGALIVRVLDLDALIEVKREVGRDKDLATLPVLVRTLEERRRKGDR
jgi:hypothetical protein